MGSTNVGHRKGYKGLPMEGPIAHWYSRLRATKSQLALYRKQAAELTSGLPDGAAVLEVAPGPGYLAVEMARPGRLRVSALEISRSFVKIASRNALRAQVSLDVRQGDAAEMPFADDSFDLIVCQAAFKNFAHPAAALDEMHRVLRRGGAAVIQDMTRDSTRLDIEREVGTMALGRLNSFMTRRTLTALRRRAYSPAQFRALAGASAFGGCEITTRGIGMEVRLEKPAAD